MAAYLRHDCGRCKVETVEKGEAELRAWSIGEWGGGERGRARRSSCDDNGDGGCYGGCAEVQEEAENENGSAGMERARAGLVVVRSGPSWPRWAGRRRRVARYWLHAATKLWRRSATEAG